jgi:hypothetical protein
MNPTENSVGFGAPGIEPRWTSSAKEGLGTAYHWSRQAPPFPREIEEGIDGYLATQALMGVGHDTLPLRASTTAPSPRQ